MKNRSIVPLILSLLAITASTPALAQKSGSIDLYLAESTTEVPQNSSLQEIFDKAPSYYEDKQAWVNYFNTEISRYLELGGDPNTTIYNGYTLLHLAAFGGNIELVESQCKR
jgi:hypothetical protein